MRRLIEPAIVIGIAATPVVAATPPKPVHISSPPYPAHSIYAGEQGVTSFRAIIGLDGRVKDCIVTASSGYVLLDDMACNHIKSQFLFIPAKDDKDRPVHGSYSNRVRWILPLSEPRIEQPGVEVIARVPSGDGRHICRFSDGVGIAVNASVPCSRTSRPYQGLDKNSLCRAMKTARKVGSASYPDYISELTHRGLTEKKCAVRWDKILLGAVVAAAVVAAASGSNGAGGSSHGSLTDSSYSWDQQNSASGGVEWKCRGEQTGRYANEQLCYGKPILDSRWPGLGAN